MKIDFNFIVGGLTTQRQNRPGAAGDPRIQTLIVGEGTLMQIAEKSIKQLKGNFNVPLFTSLDEALAHARVKIKSW